LVKVSAEAAAVATTTVATTRTTAVEYYDTTITEDCRRMETK
jgi:hypothetical protein